MFNVLFKRCAALGAVSALAFVGVTTANADPSPLNVDPAQNGKTSIHLVKYFKTDTTGKTPGTGEKDTSITGRKIPGVTFTLEKVKTIGSTNVADLDYTKNETWRTLANLVDSYGRPNGTVVTEQGAGWPKTKVTNASGEADFDALDFGVYKITETSAPSSVSKKMDPFYLTLPLAKHDGSGWLYKVHLYPKNVVVSQTDKVEKEVDDSKFYVSGDTISYKIKTSVYAPQGLHPDKYVITDVMYPDNMVIDPQDRKISVKLKNSTDNMTLGVKGSGVGIGTNDYYIEDVCPTTSYTTDKYCFQVVLTEAGRKKVAEAFFADANDQVVVSVSFKINITSSTEAASRSIINKAYFLPNSTVTNNEKLGYDTYVNTYMHEFGISKYDYNASSTYLEGATFSIYKTLADAKAGTNPLVTEYRCDDATHSTTKGAQIGCKIGPLRSSSYENNKSVDSAKQREYYLVETKAPIGYGVAPDPMPIKLSSTGSGYVKVNVPNYKTNAGFTITNTGASGPVLFALAGIILLGIAVGFYTKKQRSAVIG